MKKNVAITLVIGFLVMAMFSACKSEGPTTPVVPNSFKITDVRDVGGGMFLIGNYSILCLYTNATKDKGYAIGKIYFGDGTSEDLPDNYGSLLSDTFNRELDIRLPSNGHLYPVADTYHVKVELTAKFSNGDILSSFEKDFVITE